MSIQLYLHQSRPAPLIFRVTTLQPWPKNHIFPPIFSAFLWIYAYHQEYIFIHASYSLAFSLFFSLLV